MRLKTQLVAKEILGDHMLIAGMQQKDDFHGMVQSNETAAFIVDCLKEETTPEEIYVKLSKTFEGDEQQMRADIARVIEQLDTLGLLEKERSS